MNAQGGFTWPRGVRAAVSLSFDDGRPSQVDEGLPILDAHGLKATFYVNPGRMLGKLEGWRKAVASGHEIGNHTASHPCSGNFSWSRNNALEDYTLERMEEEIGECNERVRDALGVTPRTFGYPCGQTFVGRGEGLRSYVPLVARLFLAGRSFWAECMNDPRVCDLANLASFLSDHLEYGLMRAEMNLGAMVGEACKTGSWLILTCHDVGRTPHHQTTTIGELDGLCRLLKDPARGIWTGTVAEVAQYIKECRGSS